MCMCVCVCVCVCVRVCVCVCVCVRMCSVARLVESKTPLRTCSRVWHDTLTRVSWLVSMHSHTFTCMAWFVYAFTCVTWFVWHILYMCPVSICIPSERTKSHRNEACHVFECDMLCMNASYICVLSRSTFLQNGPSHIGLSHVTSSNVTCVSVSTSSHTWCI